MRRYILLLVIIELLGGIAMGQSTTFSYTDGVQTYTVPAGVTALNVTVNGAKGADADYSFNPYSGGLGGRVTATLAVTGGEVLNIYVGGQGTVPGAGYNGGGAGNSPGGGGGGGASDIRVGGTALTNRVIVAGGGGGAGGANLGAGTTYPDGNGAGGGLTGADGTASINTDAPYYTAGAFPTGGTQSSGGSAGTYVYTNPETFIGSGTAGALGSGGAGYFTGGNSFGGGGGGGYYGGGGGAYGIGGGGSSYANPTATSNVVHTQGVNSGNGQVVVSTIPGAALNFDGATTFVEKTGTSVLVSFPLTVEAWVQPTTRSDGTAINSYPNMVVSDDNPGSYGHGFGCEVLATGPTGITVEYHNGFRYITPPTPLVSGTWYHIAVVYTSGEVKTYLGTQGGSSTLIDDLTFTQSSPFTGQSLIEVGKHNNDVGYATRRFFLGSIDEVRIWNRALCLAEINNNMNCELSTSPDPTGLVTYYQFNEGIAGATNTGVTTATDGSGNGNNGTLYNFALTGSTSNWVSPGGVTTGVSCPAFSAGNLAVTGNGNAISDASVTTSTTNNTSFGSVPSNTSRTYAINNTGTGSLTVSGITLSGSGAASFEVGGISFPATIAAGSSATFTLTIGSPTLGSKTATVTINNSTCEPAYTFAVTGNVTVAGDLTNCVPAYSSASVDCMSAVNLYINNFSFTGAGGSSLTDNGSGCTGTGYQDRRGVVSTVNVNQGGSYIASITVGGYYTQNVQAWIDFNNDGIYQTSEIVGGVNNIENTQTFTLTIPAGVPLGIHTLRIRSGYTVTTPAYPGLDACADYQYGEAQDYNADVVTSCVAPGITCSGNVTQGNDAGFCSAVVSYSAATATGTSPSITYSQNSGTSFPAGVTTVTATATNGCGTASCNFTVTVNDVQGPTATCQNVDIYLSGVTTITPAQINNGSTDNCTAAGSLGLSLGSSQTSFSCADVGTPVGVTLTVTDASSNTNTCAATVTVHDDIAPTATCQNVDIYLSGATTITSAQINNGSTDNCTAAGSLGLSLGSSQTSFSCADVGTPVGVTLTVTDASSNSNTCAATVTVHDDVAPTATCQNVDIYLSGATTITPAQINNGSTDNCTAAGSLGLSLGSSQTSFSCADVGTPVGVTLTVTDASSNSNTCAATVTVHDDVAPTATCQNVDIYLSGATTITPAQINNGSTDNCTAAGSLGLSLGESQTSFSCADVGTPVGVTLTVTDASSNTNTCAATVTVHDDVAPTATCQNVEIYLSGVTTITPAQINNGSTDNCTAAGSLGLSLGESQTSFSCADVGTPVGVTLTVTDASSNTNTCAATVTVHDDVAPTATCQNVDIYLSGATTITPAQINNGSTDNCTAAGSLGLSLGSSQTSFSCADVGTPVGVTLTVTDASSNTNTCAATVTVHDDVAPTATCQNVNIYLSGATTITPAQINNGSTDNCTAAGSLGLSLGSSQTSFSCADVGTPVGVTLTVTDASSNTNTCAATVTVHDDVAPTATCRNVNIYLSGATTITPAQINNGSTDNCTAVGSLGLSLGSSQTSFSCADVGTPVGVTLTVTDASSNTNTCAATVSVHDDVAPTITAPATLTINGWCRPVSLASAGVSLGTPITGDNCGVASVANNAPALFPVGTTSVTWTVTDVHGNTATAAQSVVVNGATLSFSTTVDNVSCYGGYNGYIDADVSGGTSPYFYSWSTGGAGYASYDDLYFAPAGTYTVTATDWHSCAVTASYPITQPPVLTLSGAATSVSCHGGSNGSITTTVGGGTPGYSYIWSGGAAGANPTGLSAGTYYLTVYDTHGCSISGVYTITQPATLNVSAAVSNVNCNGGSNGSIVTGVTGGTSSYSYLWSPGSATTSSLTGKAAGTYSVTVTDAHSCTATAAYTITQPAVLGVSGILSNVSCHGGSNGSINTTVSGGTTSYSYVWSNGSHVADPGGLTSGTYSVTVTDAHGCTATASYTLTQPSAALSVSGTVTNETCNGGNNGGVTTGVTGGTPSYSYAWSCGGSTANLTGKTAGTYNVTVTDAHGCTASGSYTLTQPAALSCSITVTPSTSVYTGGVPTNIYLGYGPQSATLTASATGGSGYTYLWSSTGGTGNLSNVHIQNPVFTATTPGHYTYVVTITSNTGCTTTCSVSICVVDAVDHSHPGNVLICHAYGCSPITVSCTPAAVLSHFPSHCPSDHLGPVGSGCTTSGRESGGEETATVVVDELTVSAYPNPYSSEVNLKIESNLTDKVDVMLFDITGRVRQTMLNQEPNSTVTLGMDLTPGIYIIEVKQDGISKMVKVVKN